MGQEGNNRVINLSKKLCLTDAQLILSEKGLTFILTTGCNKKKMMFQYRHDLQQYHRRVKLAVYYENEPDTEPQQFTLKSDWSPAASRLPSQLLHLIDKDLQYFDEEFKPNRVQPFNIRSGYKTK